MGAVHQLCGARLSSSLHAAAIQRVPLPWGAWYGDGDHVLECPAAWSVELLEPPLEPPLTRDAIASAVATSVDGPSLGNLAQGRKNACVVIDDLTRPTPTADLLPPIVRILSAHGIATKDITILVATGTHRRLTPAEIQIKLGAAYSDEFRIEVHDPDGDLVNTGIKYGNNDLLINRTFSEADLRVAVGSVLPHSFAGYSGGAKAVIPGLSDVEATARTHKFVQMGLSDGNDTSRNRFRLEIEALVRRIRLDYVISVVPNGHMKAVGVYAGDLILAHRAACTHAGRSYATPLERTYDAFILNAYPKDTDLIQASSALLCLRGLRSSPVKAGRPVVLASATSQGAGQHGLFSPGMVSYREPRPLKVLATEDVLLYMPNVPVDSVHRHFWPAYRVLRDRRELIATLTDVLPPDAFVGVAPYAPLQQLMDCRDA